MRTPPDGLDVADLARLLAGAWQFPVAHLQYAPVGFGSHHWVATDASGAKRFVTVDDLDKHHSRDAGKAMTRLARAMLTARALRDAAGLAFVVAPVLAVDGATLRRVGSGYAAAVFQYIEGWPYPEGEQATKQDRAAIVDLLAQLHTATPTARAIASVEDLELAGRADLERALTRLNVRWSGGPFAEATRERLFSSTPDLHTLLREHDRLAEAASTRTVDWVITHGEPKADNFLATGAGPMLIDWDTALIAPAARDVWMVDADEYANSTGRRVSRDELTLYRLRWDLADIAAFVQEFTAPHARTPDTEIAWDALSKTLQLKDRWPELL